MALVGIPSGSGLGIGAGLLLLGLHSQFSIPTLDLEVMTGDTEACCKPQLAHDFLHQLTHLSLLSNSMALFARPTDGNGTY